jgi:kynurenine 3-monooxygenase
MPNVRFHFNHKLTGADFRSRKAWFEVAGGKSMKWSVDVRDQEIEVDFDFLIGADGAHSATRFHLMKYLRMDYQQSYIDTLWCEFTIDPSAKTNDDPNSIFKISPNHLHIWPGKEFMFIAIPSTVCILSNICVKTLINVGWLIHMHAVHAFTLLLHIRRRSR